MVAFIPKPYARYFKYGIRGIERWKRKRIRDLKAIFLCKISPTLPLTLPDKPKPCTAKVLYS